MEPRKHGARCSSQGECRRRPRGVSALGALALALTGCFSGHTAEVQRSQLPPLPDPITRHAGRLVIQLAPDGVLDSQCVAYEQYQTLCFVGVRSAIEDSLADLLWPSFPEVKVRQHGDELAPGDYLVQVELKLDALPPDTFRYGWSAAAKGRWRVVRDGLPLEGESLSTRSRGDFAYGSGLGQAAGEVVDAVAAHIAGVVVRLPEPAPRQPVPLPPVVLKNSYTADRALAVRIEPRAGKTEAPESPSAGAKPEHRAKTGTAPPK